MYRVSVDVGGTFTDCIVLDPTGELHQFKSPTTPSDPSRGFVNVIEKAARSNGLELKTFAGQIDLLIHGTTLATNALINGSGARTGMITTANFRDVIEIRRAFKNVKTSMYDVFVPPYRPLVPRYLRLGVPERIIESGAAVTSLDDGAVRRAAEQLREEGVESVAICFLHSYANSAHERQALARVREVLPDAYLTASHEVLPTWREYERFSTTVVSAYVGPIVRDYLVKLERRLADVGFAGTLLLMLSSGLVDSVANCVARAVDLIGSGPAAAPAGAVHIGRDTDAEDLLSIDMGGTSLDVCMLRGNEIPTTTESWVGEERVAIKMIDIHSAGAGGGSIAWIDSLGLLRVGPQSAGAEPGPACYGQGGTEPTVTDADVVLGFVPADYFLGGELRLEREKAESAILKVATPLGLSVPAAARAIFATVNACMADAITEVSTRRGHDVRGFILVAGGGAGAGHGAFLAQLLGIRKVIVPPVAAAYSAFGMFTMDVGRDYARSYVSAVGHLDFDVVNRLYAEMEAKAIAAFRSSGVGPETIRFARSVEMRYAGQFHEVEVPMPAGEIGSAAIAAATAALHRRHHDLYTFSMPWKTVEFMTFRLKATAPKAPFHVREFSRATYEPAEALKRRRMCLFPTADLDTPIYDGSRLAAGHVIDGPAIIEEATTTVVVPPGFACAVDHHHNYVLTAAAGKDEAAAVSHQYGGEAN